MSKYIAHVDLRKDGSFIGATVFDPQDTQAILWHRKWQRRISRAVGAPHSPDRHPEEPWDECDLSRAKLATQGDVWSYLYRTTSRVPDSVMNDRRYVTERRRGAFRRHVKHRGVWCLPRKPRDGKRTMHPITLVRQQWGLSIPPYAWWATTVLISDDPIAPDSDVSQWVEKQDAGSEWWPG